MEDRERLMEVLAAYGSDPKRWPAADRRLTALLTEADSREAAEIDRLLASASRPEVPRELLGRLAARLPANTGNVVALRPRTMRSGLQALWAGAALAASLAIGVYVGGFALNDDLLDSVAALEEPLDLIGLGDAEALAEEDAA
jgi:hypothetical protein